MIEARKNLLARPFFDLFGGNLLALAVVRKAALRRRKIWVINQIFAVERATHALPLLVRYRTRGDIAILCFVNQVHRALVLTHIEFFISEGQARHGLRPKQTQHGVEHGQTNVLAFTRLFSGIKRGADGLRSRNRGDLVGDNDAKHLRSTGGAIRLNIGGTGERLNHRIVNPFVGIGALFAKTVNRNVDQLFIDLPKDRLTETHAIHGPGSKIL